MTWCNHKHIFLKATKLTLNRKLSNFIKFFNGTAYLPRLYYVIFLHLTDQSYPLRSQLAPQTTVSPIYSNKWNLSSGQLLPK